MDALSLVEENRVFIPFANIQSTTLNRNHTVDGI